MGSATETPFEDSQRICAIIPAVGPFPDMGIRAIDMLRIYDSGRQLNHRAVMSVFQIGLGEGSGRLAVLDSMMISYIYNHKDNPMSRVSDLNVRVSPIRFFPP